MDLKEQKATFNEEITYKKSVKPFIGIKVFRDGFRVIPYGDADNDWLNLDRARVGPISGERKSKPSNRLHRYRHDRKFRS